MTLGWSFYNIYLCIVTLGALWERRQARRHHRLVVSGQAMVQFPRVRERLPVDLVDLSLSGLGFVSKFGFEVKDRERVIVEAASADGLVSYFEAEVRRVQRRGATTLCGAHFLTPAADASRTSSTTCTATAGAGSRCGTRASAASPSLAVFWTPHPDGRCAGRGSASPSCFASPGPGFETRRHAPQARRGGSKHDQNRSPSSACWRSPRCPRAAETIKLRLQDLTALKKLELRCVSDEREVAVPVPERWEVKRMVLHLRYTVSTNLLPESSQLVVKVGGHPVAQARLNPMAPDVKLGVEIPPGLLEPGYNALSFHVAQHFSKNQCESPCAPDLWTNISLRDSWVEMDYEWKDVPLAAVGAVELRLRPAAHARRRRAPRHRGRLRAQRDASPASSPPASRGASTTGR